MPLLRKLTRSSPKKSARKSPNVELFSLVLRGKALVPAPVLPPLLSSFFVFVFVEGHVWILCLRASLALSNETGLVYLPSVCFLYESKLKCGSKKLSPALAVRGKKTAPLRLGGENRASSLCKSKQRTSPCPRWGV